MEYLLKCEKANNNWISGEGMVPPILVGKNLTKSYLKASLWTNTISKLKKG